MLSERLGPVIPETTEIKAFFRIPGRVSYTWNVDCTRIAWSFNKLEDV